jgi:hypothetical protein
LSVKSAVALNMSLLKLKEKSSNSKNKCCFQLDESLRNNRVRSSRVIYCNSFMIGTNIRFYFVL